MSRHQKPSPSHRSDWFQQEQRRMGSFLWEDECNSMHYTQHHNNRPLSVVLTEPLDPFEPQPSSFFDDIPYIESDFTLPNCQVRQNHHHHHHHHHHRRSRSSGRRFKRECYSVYYPNTNFNSFCFLSPPRLAPPPPLPPRRPLNRCASREVLIEKIETVTIEEPHRPPPCMVSCVRTPSPTIRQVKIRPRPTSCVDLHRTSADISHQKNENRWSKCVDERREEHFEFNFSYKVPERVVPIERDLPPPPPPLPRIILHDATTSTDDLYIPAPKPIRPKTRDTGTTTAGLPRRPLCVTETQVIERFEKTEKVRCDSTSSTGTVTKVSNPLCDYSTGDRRYEKSRVVVRPTSKPREILVDTSGIIGCPSEFSEPPAPRLYEKGCPYKPRSPFRLPELN